MELIFKLSEEEAQKILNALVKEPYIEVNQVIDNLQVQAAEQMKAKK